MDSIASFDAKSLRKVQTSVRTTDGRRYTETRDDTGEPRATSPPRSDGQPGYVVDLQPDLQIGQVLPGLYIGSQDAAADSRLLQARGVTHVVNAAAATVPNFQEGNGVTYLPLQLLDLPEFTLTRDTVNHVCDFIDTALSSGGAVFVHCNAGISRSGALVVAYLILRRGMNLAGALEKARAARSLVRPNDGFMRQLAEL